MECFRNDRVSASNSCDVVFKVFEKEKNPTEESSNEVEVPETVTAHKSVLKMLSPVFKQMFDGPLKKNESIETVEVRGCSPKAFKVLIDLIYEDKTLLKNQGFSELFEIVKLADKYDIQGLYSKLKIHLTALPVTRAKVLEVLPLVGVHQGLSGCEELCTILVKNCAQSLHMSMDGEKDVYKLYQELEAEDLDQAMVDMLFKYLKEASGKTTRERRVREEAENLRTRNGNEIQSLKNKPEKEIESLKNKHEKEIESHKNKHEKEIESLKKGGHCINCGELKTECKDGLLIRNGLELIPGLKVVCQGLTQTIFIFKANYIGNKAEGKIRSISAYFGINGNIEFLSGGQIIVWAGLRYSCTS